MGESGRVTKRARALRPRGVNQVETADRSSPPVADKMLIVDVMAFALDHKPPATVIIVT